MKKKNIKNKIAGIFQLLAAFALLVVAGWLYSKVWGTALLYTDSSLGKIAAYYWVLFIPAAVLAVMGLITVRKKVPQPAEQLEEEVPKQAAENVQEQPAEQPVANVPEQPVEQPVAKVQEQPAEENVPKLPNENEQEQPAENKPAQPAEQPATKEQEESSDKCPNCGATIKPGNKFCVSCGHKLL